MNNYARSVSLLADAMDGLEDTDPYPIDPHGLMALLNTSPGMVIICRCTDTFPDVTSWQDHRDDDR